MCVCVSESANDSLPPPPAPDLILQVSNWWWERTQHAFSNSVATKGLEPHIRALTPYRLSFIHLPLFYGLLRPIWKRLCGCMHVFPPVLLEILVSFQVEFEWIRQFWFQGRRYRKCTDWWDERMAALEECWKTMKIMVCSTISQP